MIVTIHPVDSLFTRRRSVEHYSKRLSVQSFNPLIYICGLNDWTKYLVAFLVSGGFSFVVGAAIYKGGSDNKQTSFRADFACRPIRHAYFQIRQPYCAITLGYWKICLQTEIEPFFHCTENFFWLHWKNFLTALAEKIAINTKCKKSR